jgi:hypothetical protein
VPPESCAWAVRLIGSSCRFAGNAAQAPTVLEIMTRVAFNQAQSPDTAYRRSKTCAGRSAANPPVAKNAAITRSFPRRRASERIWSLLDGRYERAGKDGSYDRAGCELKPIDMDASLIKHLGERWVKDLTDDPGSPDRIASRRFPLTHHQPLGYSFRLERT